MEYSSTQPHTQEYGGSMLERQMASQGEMSIAPTVPSIIDHLLTKRNISMTIIAHFSLFWLAALFFCLGDANAANRPATDRLVETTVPMTTDLVLADGSMDGAAIVSDGSPSGKFRAEAQYRAPIAPTPAYLDVQVHPFRPNTDSKRVPPVRAAEEFCFVEAYLTNQADQPVEWTKAFLNGQKLGEVFPQRDLVWWQFYPTPMAKPGETIELQICLAHQPKEALKIEAETRMGQRVGTEISSYVSPSHQITGVSFSSDRRKVNATYDAPPLSEVVEIEVNGIDRTKSARILGQPDPAREFPGMIEVTVPDPVAAGELVDLRLHFKNQAAAHCIVRASKGILLDAFGVPPANSRIRKLLGVDLAPNAVMTGSDPACCDRDPAMIPGADASYVLNERRSMYGSGDQRLALTFTCWSTTPAATLPIYGQCADGILTSPYRLGHSEFIPNELSRFLDEEENAFRWAQLGAQPRPWYWIPECYVLGENPFTRHHRMLENKELRSLAYAALGHGAKGINYFSFGVFGAMDPCRAIGFINSVPLTEEIKKLNADIRNLEAPLSSSLPMTSKTIGDGLTGLRYYLLGSPQDGMVLIVRNLDYRTDLQQNELGDKPRFSSVVKKDVNLRIELPTWAAVSEASEVMKEEGGGFNCRIEGKQAVIQLGNLSVGRVIWLKPMR